MTVFVICLRLSVSIIDLSFLQMAKKYRKCQLVIIRLDINYSELICSTHIEASSFMINISNLSRKHRSICGNLQINVFKNVGEFIDYIKRNRMCLMGPANLENIHFDIGHVG